MKVGVPFVVMTPVPLSVHAAVDSPLVAAGLDVDLGLIVVGSRKVEAAIQASRFSRSRVDRSTRAAEATEQKARTAIATARTLVMEGDIFCSVCRQ